MYYIAYILFGIFTRNFSATYRRICGIKIAILVQNLMRMFVTYLDDTIVYSIDKGSAISTGTFHAEPLPTIAISALHVVPVSIQFYIYISF